MSRTAVWLPTMTLAALDYATQAAPLGLPEVPIPAGNPQTDAGIMLGEMINRCIENPLESAPLALDSPGNGSLAGLHPLRAARRGVGARQALNV